MNAGGTEIRAGDLVRRVLGEEALAADPAAWATRDGSPGAVALPASAEEAAELLRAAASEGVRVLVAGRGTWIGGGDLPGPVDVVLSTLRMDRILQYEPADLTLTAGAGIGLDALGATAAAHGQWLAVDPPGARDGTLGATIATGMSGFLATRYGAVRDQVLGLTLVTGDGRTLELGGRVVKNVAGFDLVRLVVGSRGSLGLVARATVRLQPLPRGVARLRARAGRMEELVEAARTVATGPVVPARLELREGPDPAGEGRAAVLDVTLHDSEAAVEAEAARLARDVGALEVAGDELPRPEPAREPDLVVRMAARRGDLGALLGVARTLGRLEGGRNALEDAPVVLRADPLRGRIRIVVPNVRTDGTWAERWRDRLADLRRTLDVRGGGLVIESAPAPMLEGLHAHAPPRGPEATIVERLREHFDPAAVLASTRRDFDGARAPEGRGGDGGEGATEEWA